MEYTIDDIKNEFNCLVPYIDKCYNSYYEPKDNSSYNKNGLVGLNDLSNNFIENMTSIIFFHDKFPNIYESQFEYTRASLVEAIKLLNNPIYNDISLKNICCDKLSAKFFYSKKDSFSIVINIINNTDIKYDLFVNNYNGADSTISIQLDRHYTLPSMPLVCILYVILFKDKKRISDSVINSYFS